MASYSLSDKLKDGTEVIVRAINSDDRDSVLAIFTNLDRDSVYTRFFTYKRVLTEHELRQLTDVDNDHLVALVVGFRDQE